MIRYPIALPLIDNKRLVYFLKPHIGLILKEGTYREQGELIQGIKTTFAVRDREIKPLLKEELSSV